MSRRALEPQSPFSWRTVVLVLCLAMSLALSALAYQAAIASRLPPWIEIQEGPVAHGVDKFYRNAYFKGNIETAGNVIAGGTLTVVGTSNLLSGCAISGVYTLTTLTVSDNTVLGDVVTDTIAMNGRISTDITLANREIIGNSKDGVITVTAPLLAASNDLQVTRQMTVGGQIALQNGETIVNSKNDVITLTTSVLEASNDLRVSRQMTVGGQIALQNGETISNSNDGVVQIGGFLALQRGDVLDLADGRPITPTVSYQPLTVAAAATITTGNPSIVSGTLAGQLLVLVNEDDQNIVIVDDQNVKCGGDITLTANADDSAMFIWDGTDWICLAFHDN